MRNRVEGLTQIYTEDVDLLTALQLGDDKVLQVYKKKFAGSTTPESELTGCENAVRRKVRVDIRRDDVLHYFAGEGSKGDRPVVRPVGHVTFFEDRYHPSLFPVIR